MKKNVSIVVTATLALCIGLQSAGASLLGMPLNLRTAIELTDAKTVAPSYRLYTDVLTGLLLVKSC
jgi:hypothetical protein